MSRHLTRAFVAVALAALPSRSGAGLVAAYAFDEGAGTTAADSSGAGNTGALSAVAWTPSGRHNAAVSFDGASSAITVANSAGLNFTSSFTLSAWVRPTALGGYQTIVMKEVTGNASYWLQAVDDEVGSGIHDGTSFREHLTSGANLANGTWSHLASVFDDAANTFSIYVDGALVLSQPETAAMVANGQGLVFGQSHVGERWNGLVDDARIYNHALTQAEIQADMATAVSTPPPVDTTPPSGAIISPTRGSAVWGMTTITALAADAESGIAGVQFRLDGADLGSEVNVDPFQLAWNTTTTSAGAHVLTAIVRNGAGLTAATSAVGVTVAAAPARLLRTSGNDRYLVDGNGAPFLIAGDAPQSLTVNLSLSEADMYFANRQRHGFNALWVNLLCNDGTAGRANGSTFDGILPFTGYLPGHAGDPEWYDLATPNPAFFARVDAMIDQAAKYGLVFVLDPIETIGWLRNNGNDGVLLHNGPAAARAYGRFLGSRYQDFPNIVWMCGNDFQNWMTPAADAVVTAVAYGIQDTDSNHIHTVELDYLVSGSLDDPLWEPIISLNATYSYYPTYAQVLVDYNRPNFLPVFLIEANYEFESLQGPVTTAPILRRQEWWTLLSGGAGQMYGSGYTWTFQSGWQGSLDSPGARQMPHLEALLEPRAWFDLVPDQDDSVLTAGRGTFSDLGYVADNDYAVAARTPDGRLVIAYMPTLRALTVDMSRLSALSTARWYDPSRGSYAGIAGSPFANAGSRVFTPPGNNGDGDGDWVLVIETEPPEPLVTAVRPPGIDCLVGFTTLAGERYRLLRTDDIRAGIWTDVATDVPGTGGRVEIPDSAAAGAVRLFYRAEPLP